ncbi:MAG: PAS domain S-box protein [Bacteroidetes bacterium]|nr:PAS domain S-box protein [Bacteroidota bacterium]
MSKSLNGKKYFRESVISAVLVVLSVILVILYIFMFSRIKEQMGETGGILMLIPVVLSAWSLGARGGMLAGLAVGLVNLFLHGFSPQKDYLEFIFIITSGIIAVTIGWVTGRFSELRISSLLFGINLDTDAERHKVADILHKRTKEMVARERNLLRMVIDNLPDKIYVKDNIGRYIINNAFHLESLGLSRQDETSGKTVYDFFPEKFARQFAADEQKIIQTGEPLIDREEEVINSRTGKINWHLTSKLPIKDNDGKIIGIVGISRDITESKLAGLKRKEAEDAMRQSEERFRAVVEQSADAIFITDPDTMNIVDSNHAFQEMLGYSQEESRSLPVDKFIVTSIEEIKRNIGDIISSHQPVSGEWQLKRKDGSVIDVVVSANSVTYGGKQLVCMFARDVTEWKLLQNENYKLLANLSESEHKFRTLFENLTEGVALHEMIYDENGKAVDYRIVDINPAYEKHTGLLQKKSKGLLASVLYGTEKPPYFEQFEEVVRTGEPKTFETYFQPLERYFRIGVVSPKHGAFATVFEDITERIQKQKELEDKNAELERFTYTVSHDLKSPLITIKGFAGALLHDVMAGRHQRLEDDLRRIADAADKMSGLLGNLLELSRIGRIINPMSDVNLADLAREVTALLAGTLENKVEVDIKSDLPMVFGDQRRLAQVLQNLIENAVKFMGNQPNPRIVIGTRKDNEEQVVYVQDNGIGIDPNYHQTVFGLFNKLDTGTQGTGIGLALVRRIVEIHGGRVWVESQGRGFGSTFCFTLSSNNSKRKELQK